MGKSGAGGNKAVRMAQKQDAADEKDRKARMVAESEAASQWEEGTKKKGRRDDKLEKRDQKKHDKAARDALLEEETAGLKDKKPTSSKQAEKKGKGPDLSQLDSDSDSDDKKLATINATGIDNALDAFSIDDDGHDNASNKIERHPERRFKAAFARFEERRMEEMKEEMKTLGSGEMKRLNLRRAQIRKEFERHPDNPFNQTTAKHNATKQELKDIRTDTAAAIERRLAEKDDDEEDD